MVRTFGWVQDAASLRKLRLVVEIFVPGSSTHKQLDGRIRQLVFTEELQDRFLTELSRKPMSLQYRDLVGSHTSPRAMSPCDGIIQAAIPGQRREYLTDWPSDNYLRWAHCLGFVEYHVSTDSFSATPSAEELAGSEAGSGDEHKILETALLSYPPVMRCLELLRDGDHLTKFDIGNQLGFVGEEGFTSLPLGIFIRDLTQIQDSSERNSLVANSEGTSDKYARMIAGWCKQMGWLEQSPKLVEVQVASQNYSYTLGQAYTITSLGLSARRKGLGTNINSTIPKNVFWEMLATKSLNRNYVRSRRAHIVKALQVRARTLPNLQRLLEDAGFIENLATIADDLRGLLNIGLRIEESAGQFNLRDKVVGLAIPRIETRKDDLQALIDGCRERLTTVPHEYLVLIELSVSGKESMLFEAKTVELFISQFGFLGEHLGGPDKPDGIVYSDIQGHDDFGVIIDTKAYADGFNISAPERRKMTDYVDQNIRRHGSGWWDGFPGNVSEYRFLFVSSGFIGGYKAALERIKQTTNTSGAAISALNLLLLANEFQENKISLIDLKGILGAQDEIRVLV